MPRPIEFAVTHGIVTNVNPRQVQQAAFARLENADHFDKIGALSKVPGSRRVSANAGAAWVSLNAFGHFDLARQYHREVVGLAGGALYRIEDDTTITPVAHGLVSEPLSEVNTLDRVHMASPNNTPFKFDGLSVTRWGVLAPGEREIVLDPIDDDTLYTVSGGTKATKTDFAIGSACVEVAKTSVVTSDLILSRTGLALNLVPYGDTVRVWLFIPLGGLGLLRTSQFCVSLDLGDATAGLSSYRKNIGDLFEGWNRLAWVRSAPTFTGGFGPANPAAVTFMDLHILFATPLTTGAGFRWNVFHTTEDGAPKPSIASPGAVTGNVRYRVVFVSRYGQRSNAGTPSDQIYAGATGAGSSIRVGLPISTDPQVVSRRLYRDQDGDAIYRLVDIVGDNATATYLDDTVPAARDLETPPLAGDSEDDNSPAPKMSQVLLYKNHVFGLDAENPFQLNISAVLEPESWPLLSRPQFDEYLVALAQGRNGLTLHTRNPDVTYTMTGETLAEFTFIKTNPVRAAVGKRAVAPIKALIFYWHDDGPFVDDGDDPWFMGAEIHDRILAELDPERIVDCFLLNDHARLRMICFLPGVGTDRFDKIMVYEYGKRAAGMVDTQGGVDPLDVRLGSWNELLLPSSIDPRCALLAERDTGLPQVWIGGGDGCVYQLQAPGQAGWADENSVVPVACTLQTGRAAISDGDQFGRPIWLILAGRGSAASVWNVTITVYGDASGPALHSESFDVYLAGGESSIRRRIPNSRKLRGAWVDVTLSHSTTEPAHSIERIAIEPLRDRTPSRSA